MSSVEIIIRNTDDVSTLSVFHASLINVSPKLIIADMQVNLWVFTLNITASLILLALAHMVIYLTRQYLLGVCLGLQGAMTLAINSAAAVGVCIELYYCHSVVIIGVFDIYHVILIARSWLSCCIIFALNMWP